MIELRPLTVDDIAAHNAGEDADTVRWLSGFAATEDSTRRHFAVLTDNAARGQGKRGFGIWWAGRLAGYIDPDPDDPELPAPGDVNIASAVHPWARRRGIAAAAVDQLCTHLEREGIGRRAVIRTAPDDVASMEVARRCRFRRLPGPAGGTAPTGAMAIFVREPARRPG